MGGAPSCQGPRRGEALSPRGRSPEIDPLPRIAITPGSPSGIGPEIALRAARQLRDSLRPVLVGDRRLWEEGARIAGEDLDRWDLLDPTPEDGALGGGPVAAAITAAVRQVRSGEAAALCTAPINKAELHAQGLRFPGHTELLGHLAGAEPLMVLAGPKLRVGLLTVHVPLREVPDLLTVADTLAAARIARQFLRRDLGISSPRIALAGLNPHAGEGGAFGDEELRVLGPAVAEARAQGIELSGPLPADTVFTRALAGEFDLVLTPTHDQGLIAVKTAHFGQVVNITCGLPFVRTSPDHGTASDLHGTGRADPSSMVLALATAAEIGKNRQFAPT